MLQPRPNAVGSFFVPQLTESWTLYSPPSSSSTRQRRAFRGRLEVDLAPSPLAAAGLDTVSFRKTERSSVEEVSEGCCGEKEKSTEVAGSGQM